MAFAVVDSSVVIKWLVPEPHSADARRLLNDYQAGTLTLLAPDLLHAEIGNILWKKHRFQGLAAADAQTALDSFRALTFTLTSASVLLAEAYALAVAHHCTVYDALYVALSVREHCPLVTADQKLIAALKTSFSHVMWVADWP
jgi:predicted nucleic acid-binding protein